MVFLKNNVMKLCQDEYQEVFFVKVSESNEDFPSRNLLISEKTDYKLDYKSHVALEPS